MPTPKEIARLEKLVNQMSGAANAFFLGKKDLADSMIRHTNLFGGNGYQKAVKLVKQHEPDLKPFISGSKHDWGSAMDHLKSLKSKVQLMDDSPKLLDDSPKLLDSKPPDLTQGMFDL